MLVLVSELLAWPWSKPLPAPSEEPSADTLFVTGLLGHAVNIYLNLTLIRMIAFLHSASADSEPGSLLRKSFPYSIDGADSVKEGGPRPLLRNVFGLTVFAVQHSSMSRLAFKLLVPASLLFLERTFYCLCSAMALQFAMMNWQPIATPVFDLLPMLSAKTKARIELAAQIAGFAVMMAAAKHLDQPEGSFFGMWQAAEGKALPLEPSELSREGILGVVRHPIMTGFLMMFWSCANPSKGRLVFNAYMTAYIFVAVFGLEEPALEAALGSAYTLYKQQVAAFVPLIL